MENREQFIYIIKPSRLEMLVDGGTAEEAAIIGQHFNYLQNLTEEGTAVIVGRTLTTGPESIGIVIFYAQNEDEAKAIMDADPAVAMGVMKATLHPFRIALMARA